MLEIVWSELSSGFPDTAQLVRVIIRLVAAMLMGAVVGFERERAGKAAGLRTHILVALGTALFVISAIDSGMSSEGVSRVIQGITAGIGFLGAGAILKLSESKEIKGLTTAASIWMTAAIGVTVGMGQLGLALLGAVLTLVVLAFLSLLEDRLEKTLTSKEEQE